jgi:hypothetical protein
MRAKALRWPRAGHVLFSIGFWLAFQRVFRSERLKKPIATVNRGRRGCSVAHSPLAFFYRIPFISDFFAIFER